MLSIFRVSSVLYFMKTNTMLDNAGLGFGLKCTKHCLVSEILKEKHTPSAILFHNLLYLSDVIKLTVNEFKS